MFKTEISAVLKSTPSKNITPGPYPWSDNVHHDNTQYLTRSSVTWTRTGTARQTRPTHCQRAEFTCDIPILLRTISHLAWCTDIGESEPRARKGLRGYRCHERRGQAVYCSAKSIWGVSSGQWLGTATPTKMEKDPGNPLVVGLLHLGASKREHIMHWCEISKSLRDPTSDLIHGRECGPILGNRQT